MDSEFILLRRIWVLPLHTSDQHEFRSLQHIQASQETDSLFVNKFYLLTHLDISPQCMVTGLPVNSDSKIQLMLLWKSCHERKCETQSHGSCLCCANQRTKALQEAHIEPQEYFQRQVKLCKYLKI